MTPFSWAEEERASAALSRRVQAFDDEAADEPPAEDLSGSRRGGGEDAGRALVGRLGPFNRKRLATLLRFEREGGLQDYGILMAPLCVLMESELVRVLGEPARGVRTDLARVLEEAGRDTLAELLHQWTPKRFATLGTVGIIAHGMRKALTATADTPAGDAVRQFVKTLPAGYADAVREKDYGNGLEQLRGVRNRVAHTDALFTKREYEKLVEQAVCHNRVYDWHATGPALNPVPWHLGTLHHHLLAVPPVTPPATADPVSRLFDARPSSGGGGVRLSVCRPAVSGSRARVVPRPTDPNAFPLGSLVVYEVTAAGGAGGHLLLLNRDVFGVIRVLARGVLTAAAGFRFPNGEFDVRLTDGPGEEVVKAVVSRRPLPLPADDDDPTPEMSDAQAEALAGTLDGLPAGEWWESTVRMTVAG